MLSTNGKLNRFSISFTPVQEIPQPDPRILIEIVQMRMPYGKYKGTILADIPISYLEWMAGKGFTKDKLGMMLSTVFEIKTNGLSEILYQIRKSLPKVPPPRS
ncbi:DUF3820 family protein [Mucilaginibacter myungsuensis]|uniref:DUF3820 family protein n=1 Tax=Mucilaginibacter myungsuensis TaxID=649104 RepID=A0A929KZU2_9SPHI|nr:DUF3820 family protein [Mucilaginibacter myungsuensis]MBE9663493.1 DUF3820 family protein [Mucilaginibacter myungsuensis]MDN3600231.1 DUF3820 family protein [Mucilaginibacter myungsuensis]